MLRLLPPLCWTGVIAHFGGGQWSGAHTAAWLDAAAVATAPRLLAARRRRREAAP